jgi:hypothetical protein
MFIYLFIYLYVYRCHWQKMLQGIHGCAKGFLLSEHLKNKRLEHHSYKQKRNFIDRERLSGETHSGVQKLGAPWVWEGWGIYIFKASTLTQSMWSDPIDPFLAHMGLSVLSTFSGLGWYLCFFQAVGASTFLRCHRADLWYGTATYKTHVWLTSSFFFLELLLHSINYTVQIIIMWFQVRKEKFTQVCYILPEEY